MSQEKETMEEQRQQILQLLAEGKITAAEAEALIDALEPEQSETSPRTGPAPKSRFKYLRVVVNSAEKAEDDGPTRVNVRIPLQLLRAGVRLSTLIPPQALAPVSAALSRSGVPIDLSELNPQHIEDLVEQLAEVTIDIDDPDTQVQVFCE
ncbi:SHOCT-like domain-containing protein [Streptomyces lancefieldiae]|uniref:YvlB/LiaX N-terminal domain-containing protein n=1 Tax=Streptomyces lancefieldiae TaxID=3075520 RepID=A0ABU3B1V9_9ACTN|nr:hypothetical protein [Streptomyces sp. DSM 40712]MDT0616055.1 hypothetical protein [Streptomyces sp. DSM 40712]